MSLDNLAAQRRCVHEAFFEFAGVLKIIVFLTEDHKNGPFDQVAWPGQKRRRAPFCVGPTSRPGSYAPHDPTAPATVFRSMLNR